MTKGKVSGIIANMVTLAVDGPVAQYQFLHFVAGFCFVEVTQYGADFIEQFA